MAIEVRIIEPDEFPAWVALMNLAFFFDGDADAQAEFNRPFTDLSRVFAAFDDDCLVGTLRSFATELTTPGGVTLSASALTGVAVASTHRRRGLMTAMCTVELRASVERGEPISILIASEYPIYGRFGFGPSTWHATYTVDTGAARFVRPAAGCVELVEPTALREQVTRLYESFRLDRPGAISRRPHWWDLNLGIVTPPGGPRWKGRMVFYSSEEGEPAGYARYHIEAVRDGRQLKNTLVIDELLALTPAAYGRLWQYCCEVDLIATVRAPDRCVEEPLPWLLTDARAVRQVHWADFVWVRVLDVERALAGRRYAGEGRLVIEVVDDLDFTAGRYVLAGGPDGATCHRTEASADVVLPVQALGAAFLGGVPLRLLADAGWVEEQRPGALLTADALFRSAVTPWCTTWF